MLQHVNVHICQYVHIRRTSKITKGNLFIHAVYIHIRVRIMQGMVGYIYVHNCIWLDMIHTYYICTRKDARDGWIGTYMRGRMPDIIVLE